MIRRRSPRGQATVELALLLPLVVLLVLLVVQTLVVGRDYVLTVQAAREAARAQSVDPSGDGALAAVARILPGARLELTPRREIGDPIEAIVRYRARTDVALIGPLVPDVELAASVTMRAER